MEQFKKLNSFEKRKEESCRICKKHSDRVPIVVCRNIKDDNIADIDKTKIFSSQRYDYWSICLCYS